MCEFWYDFNANEPFYYCDHEHCEWSDIEERGFVTIVLNCGNRDTFSCCRTIKLDPCVTVGTMLSWLIVQGDILSPELVYRGRVLSEDQQWSSVGISGSEYVLIRTVWPHKANIGLNHRILRDADPHSWPSFVRWQTSDFLNRFQLQSEDNEASFQELILHLGERKSNFLNGDDLWLFELLENLFQTIYWLRKCECKKDFAAIAHLSYKLFTHKSITQSCKNILMRNDSILQGDFEEQIKKFREVFDLSNLVLSSPLVKKMHELYTFLLVQGFLSKFGLEITDREFRTLSGKSVRAYKQKTSFLVCVVDSALFICEKLIDYRKTGDPTAFVHTNSTYAQWSESADKCLSLAPFTSNLEAHGTTYFSYISNLNDLIEKGEAIRKHSVGNVGVESVSLSRKLQNLQLLKNVEVTRRASQKEREAPFGVLVHGDSSVGKSTFTKMLYYYYGSLHGLEKDDHFRYVRNPADEYWSNFDSSKWCIQLDDIAFLLPAKAKDIDPSLKEMLNVVNNVPYVPPQAALEDKGKTPVLAKLVVATTNAKDLNAHEYFHCPLAVRRRLYYVVNIKPKKQYLHENKKFLNTDAIPDFDGKYPDFWTITVQKVVPVEANGKDWAKLVTVAIFEDVYEFLEHFGRASMAHVATQDRSHVCDTGMRDIGVCPLCFKVSDSCTCLQVEVVTWLQTFKRACFEVMCSFILWSLSWSWVMTYLTWVARVRLLRRVLARFSNRFSTTVQLRVFALLNGAPLATEFKYALLALSAMSAMLLVGYKLRSNREKPSKANFEPQGNRFGTTEKDLPKEETENVWYKSELDLNMFDVPRASLSNSHLSDSEIRDLFAQNCVRLTIEALDVSYKCRTGGVFLKGQSLLVNGHVLRIGKRHKIFIQNMTRQGLSSNHTLELSIEDWCFSKDFDLACVQILSMPPHKDIMKYWNEGTVPHTKMISVKRDNDGYVIWQNVYNVNHVAAFPIEALNITAPVILGNGDDFTQAGDCGSLGVATTPKGPVIMGLHTIGYEKMRGFIVVDRHNIETLISQSTLIKGVNGGGKPELSLNGDIELVTPHHKSLFRYIPEGTARIYGSFPGHRPKPKSRVCDTPLQKVFLDHFATSVNTGKPVMDGWAPWNKNVVEMVKPTVNYDRATLIAARHMFMEEIKGGLPLGWEKDLVVLSDKATVNGLPGVKFIDRINCSSSMGHPWNTSKKKFLVPAPDDTYLDGVDFGADIWNKVNNAVLSYKNGQRCLPIYVGTLKDEPTPLHKIADKKTRVFTGSSIVHSLVVRKYLLSFVRLVQKNRFVFEAGPGVVVQSIEWFDIYEYLTYFGKDKMIAGDYAKFDKRMIADFILIAFDIIIDLYAQAGFEESDLQILRGIAYDTAFPLVNVNGDLVEFYGTNPSGHPLTVIINSLVNSLYMRYAYIILGKQHGNMSNFKSNVRLFTYGDDNIMGVSDAVPWFNHTTIQVVLGQIGVEYTMAEKGAASIPYISIDMCSFLKRKWRYDADVGTMVAPLEEESIHKSLTKWIPSQTIDKYAQMVAVIQSANMEYFFYGKEIFEKHHAFFKKILQTTPYCHYVTETTLPGWEELCVRFWKSSEELLPSVCAGLGRPAHPK